MSDLDVVVMQYIGSDPTLADTGFGGPKIPLKYEEFFECTIKQAEQLLNSYRSIFVLCRKDVPLENIVNRQDKISKIEIKAKENFDKDWRIKSDISISINEEIIKISGKGISFSNLTSDEKKAACVLYVLIGSDETVDIAYQIQEDFLKVYEKERKKFISKLRGKNRNRKKGKSHIECLSRARKLLKDNNSILEIPKGIPIKLVKKVAQ